VPIAVSGIFGAMSVIPVNSWMNTPGGFRPGTRVTGWASVPPADRPPVVWLIHLAFDVMAGLGSLLLAGLWAAWAWWRRRRWPRPQLFWALGAVSGLAAVVAMECGWVVTEVGRQPWPQGVRVVAALGIAAGRVGLGRGPVPGTSTGTPLTLTNAGAPHATFVALIAEAAGIHESNPGSGWCCSE
jgi:Cytochrome bd terminal oxidase subunit I